MMDTGPADLLDCGFEPQTRARSNTWPLPRPENFVDMIKEEPEDDMMKSPCAGGMGLNPTMCLGLGLGLPDGQLGAPGGPGGSAMAGLPAAAAAAAAAAAKKNSSRRNAWGNLSYADLITQAITTAPDKRLTLSQIYEWMVHNVPYFKDKGDSNSSAGWKNSIRHNLSLHNRFMRVQNEGTGKSSWWMINPDAKPGKSARRRATSMETSKFEKRRGRVKKKVEALRNGLIAADASPSPCSSVSEGLDRFPDSPLHAAGFQLSPDFRPRASSNASSCGRLSPIPAVEPDWTPYYAADQLAGNLEQNMKLDLHQDLDLYTAYPSQSQSQQEQPSGPPPPYQSPFDVQFGGGTGGGGGGAGVGGGAAHLSFVTTCPLHRTPNCSCMVHCAGESISPNASCAGPAGVSPSYQQSEPSPQQQQPSYQPPSPDYPDSLPPEPAPASPDPNPCALTAPTTMMGQLMGALNPALLDDLNLNIEGGFDCNVDEVIKQELSLEGSLDFNFGQQHLQTLPQGMGVSGGAQGGGQLAASTQGVPPYTSGQSWVH